MKENPQHQKEIIVKGQTVSVWRIVNEANDIAFNAMLLTNKDLFVPINGGSSADEEYDMLAKRNVGQVFDKVRPVENSFKALGVILNGKTGDVISYSHYLSGITGILLESHGDILEDLISAYPGLKIEPYVES